MGKYCCFHCPAKDYSEKALSDRCPGCHREYGFALDSPPSQVRGFKIVRSLGRGFYGAAYVAESGIVDRRYVVKISPVSFYTFFSKTPFEDEVRLHARLAENATHVVRINDAFRELIKFSDTPATEIECFVTVLDYVDGPTLKEFVERRSNHSAAAICQIAIDLLELRAEFEANRMNHNDLHSENLIVESVAHTALRHNVIEPRIRVMAIDLGSMSEESKSTDMRQGDLAFIAAHVERLLQELLANPDSLEDRDFRVALSLQAMIGGMRSQVQNLRLPNPSDLAEQVRQAFYRALQPWRPWRTPLSLRAFSDHYNAQTLESWDVPRLLVDPENRWLREISKPGPQIVTGMRGCGKTMLLRSLDIHARASLQDGERGIQTLERVRSDGFIGLFASAQRLLDLREQSLLKLEHRLTRLFLAYALQAVRALLHLRDLDVAAVEADAYRRLAKAVSESLGDEGSLRVVVGLEDLEQKLQRLAVLTGGGSDSLLVSQAPADVFIHLATAFRNCSSFFANSTVFFLLDDVSTRYLDLEKIESLLSSLLFQSPICAFKFTSEWQTIELGLKSPGRIHPIRVDRDLTVFDLGADVFKTINAHGAKGKDFVAGILGRRASLHPQHPRQRDPRAMLGDVPLEQVAREIAGSNETSSHKKRVYRGLSCVTNVCVGDIGDVIKLYEEILKRAGASDSVPVPDQVQSECFQEMSSRRLYDLNRRADYFKNHALGFAQASHELLVRSGRGSGGRGRLRQFSSIYVRVTADEETAQKGQIDRLRDLIDAGVFVFAGGAPRTKTKDSDPIQQFILSYRKIYGLTSFIGLADRDRFELSGSELSGWLDLASQVSAKEILLRNQINEEVRVNGGTLGQPLAEPGEGDDVLDPPAAAAASQAELLFPAPARDAEPIPILPPAQAVEIHQVFEQELREHQVNSIVSSLGFEDRTLAANEFLQTHFPGCSLHLVKYKAEGHGANIQKVWRGNAHVHLRPYGDMLGELPRFDGLTLIDISGLTKALIFSLIRRELMTKRKVLVCHASAERYYPLEEDLQRLFAAERAKDPMGFLQSLADVLMGEVGPYRQTALLEETADASRARALIAFASAKHERLFSLLDRREYDYIEIVAPASSSPRSRVAALAAELAGKNYPNALITKIESDDLISLVEHLDKQYLDIYAVGGANLEFGLTGSKRQAVAAAVLSAQRKISQAWYVSPGAFDEKRYSTGVSKVEVFEISLPESRRH
jgi:hypothetical protein